MARLPLEADSFLPYLFMHYWRLQTVQRLEESVDYGFASGEQLFGATYTQIAEWWLVESRGFHHTTRCQLFDNHLDKANLTGREASVSEERWPARGPWAS